MLKCMGRIKTVLAKRSGAKFLKLFPQVFSKDYEKNKEALGKVGEINSKKLRNVIAGYITRLKEQEEKEAAA